MSGTPSARREVTRQDWLRDEPESIRAAAEAVAQRKIPCTQPNCCACKHDRDLVEKLIQAVRLDALSMVRRTA